MLRKLGLSIFFACAGTAAHAAYPEKPIRMILPYVAGGSLTLVGRLIANKMSENTGQSIIVDNRGGGSGKIGADAAAKANPDGYTLLLGETGAMAINVWLMGAYQVARLPAAILPAGALLLWLLGQIAVLGPARRASAIPPAIATRTV